MTGAMPSSVCERRCLLGLMSGVAVADAGTANGVAEADGGVEAGTSGVAVAEGRVDAGTSGVETAEGRDASGAEGDAASGADDGRGIGVGRRAAGLADGRGAGVDGEAAASLGGGAGAGISSAPHSESISSVGGAMDGIGGLALTRSLSDRLSVIALTSAFHGPAHKSSMHAMGRGNWPRFRGLNGRFR
jgi:hypothetical protein